MVTVVLGLGGLAAGCNPTADPVPEWTRVHDGLDWALLSVAGTAEDDVWTVGHGPSGSAPAVLHWDGDLWSTHDPGVVDVDLWWVHVLDSGELFAGGTDGTILRREAGGTWSEMETPLDTPTVFGIWGLATDDLWAVGGEPGGSDGAFIWRWDGSTWSDATPEDPTPGAWWKPWGSAAGDVWFCGTDGAVAHWDACVIG